MVLKCCCTRMLTHPALVVNGRQFPARPLLCDTGGRGGTGGGDGGGGGKSASSGF